MAILPITQNPTPSLFQRSADVAEPTSSKIKKLIADLYETMIDADGIGIAAPQVGINIRLFLVRTDEGHRVYINPKLRRSLLRKVELEEGCLSVRGVFGPVARARTVTISFTNEKGEKKTERGEGLLARVLQHEYDHIEGILFINRAKTLEPPLAGVKKI